MNFRPDGRGDAQCRQDPADRPAGVVEFVLPDPDGPPSRPAEPGWGGAIPLPVPGHLGTPVATVAGRRLEMSRATVPEAAVDEDGQPVQGEGEIREAAGDPRMPPPSEDAGSPQQAGEPDLRRPVAPGSDGSHDPGTDRRADGVGHQAPDRAIARTPAIICRGASA